MVIKCYELVFEVSEKLSNGTELRHYQTVMSPLFKNGKPVADHERIEDAKKELERIGKYYNIEYDEKPSGLTKTLIVPDGYIEEV